MRIRYIYWVSVFIFFSFTIAAQDSANVKIIVETNLQNDSSEVFITGNRTELGGWNPGKINFEKQNDSIWTRSFTFESGAVLEFKFTLGDWNTEALEKDGSVPGNHTFSVTNDTTLKYNIERWKDGTPSFTGQITGTVEYLDSLTFDFLLPRDVIVWLPPGYDENETKRYPVLYLHDGQNVIDPATSAFGTDWQIDEAADSLIRKNEIEPLIIVGIYNTRQRSREYTHTDTGSVYMRFIVEKLKPMIDEKYRTLPGREFTATGGSSAGGLISFMLLWEYSDVFSKAICMSPAFKINRIDYVSNVENYTGKRKDIQVYIDNGGVDLESRLQPGIDEMVKALERKGYKKNEDFFFVIDKDASHSENAWASRIPNALKLLFGK